MLSDIGANTLLLHPDTFVRSKVAAQPAACDPRLCAGGGGLVMVGGYLTFQGIEAKGQYAGSRGRRGAAGDAVIARRPGGMPAGRGAAVADASHPIVAGLGEHGRRCSATTG